MISTNIDIHIHKEDAITEADVLCYPPDSSSAGFVTLAVGGATIYLSEPDIHIRQIISALAKARELWNDTVLG